MSHAPKPKKPPLVHPAITRTVLVMVALSWVPFALVALSRTSLKDKPPVHIFLDMDNQPKLKAQAFNESFADFRAMRPRIPGTVAYGELDDRDDLHRGYVTDPKTGMPVVVEVAGIADRQWLDGYPEGLEITVELLNRGHERYNIYCAPCHGESGYGNGLIHQRAQLVGATGTGWVQPSDLHTRSAGKLQYGESAYPNGKLFNTISHGANSMRGYASSVPVDDRWAIVAYVRALQLSQNATLEDVPAEQRATLR